jgi:type IV fimbrial biogenesis protein FimT
LYEPLQEDEIMRKNLQKSSGFTLIELMIAIGIISILASIAVPAVMNWLPDYRLKAAARDLYSNLQSTKLNAVKSNNDWAVVFDIANNQYLICSDSGADGSWSGTADNAIVKTCPLDSYGSSVAFGHGNATTPIGATFGDEITFNNNVVVFNSRGTCNAGYVYLQNNKNSAFGIGSLSSGIVRLQKWYAASGNWE